MKVIVGLGNPGPAYDDTRHNLGWWVLDRLAYDWGFGPFERVGSGLQVDGAVGDHPVRLIKPTTFMNRSGAALTALREVQDFDVAQDLLVVLDDATLDVGRVRFRPKGGSGGHKGLTSVAGALGTKEYARLRIGVGQVPLGVDLSDWVLSPMGSEDEDTVVALLPELSGAVRIWIEEGVAEAMAQFNR